MSVLQTLQDRSNSSCELCTATTDLSQYTIPPSLNENVNEEWISDKIRFSFDGLKIQRLSFPLIKNSKGFVNVSWVFVLFALFALFADYYFSLWFANEAG